MTELRQIKSMARRYPAHIFEKCAPGHDQTHELHSRHSGAGQASVRVVLWVGPPDHGHNILRHRSTAVKGPTIGDGETRADRRIRAETLILMGELLPLALPILLMVTGQADEHSRLVDELARE